VDVNKLRVGDRIDPPYETTLENSFRDMWLSSFHSNDRINVSTPFARKIGLQVGFWVSKWFFSRAHILFSLLLKPTFSRMQ
jgi:hypothetical protein